MAGSSGRNRGSRVCPSLPRLDHEVGSPIIATETEPGKRRHRKAIWEGQGPGGCPVRSGLGHHPPDDGSSRETRRHSATIGWSSDEFAATSWGPYFLTSGLCGPFCLLLASWLLVALVSRRAVFW